MLKLFIAGQTYVMERFDALRNSEEGQTMAEYGVVLAVITLGVVVALGFLSGAISDAIDEVTSKL
jgi:Flp pilus assembly pilin Flp